LWEKEFVKMADISFFHRFRAIDQVNVACSVSTLTTLLPPKRKLPFFLTRRPNQYFCVPSEADKSLLRQRYQIAPERIFIARPSTRRLIHFQNLNPERKTTALVLVDKPENQLKIKKLLVVLGQRFPKLGIKILPIKNKETLTPKAWLDYLSNAEICFYLCSKPFDWGTLALESIFYRIPTVFLEENKSLYELLPHSKMNLTRFLLESPELSDISLATEEAWKQLKTAGVFEPLAVAERYRDIYQQIAPGITH
jgi:hypothetical protein